MRKYTLFFIIFFSFFKIKAQDIIINGTVVNVSNDISFPYWLNSMSTIEIGSQVVSISALEFNVVPTNDGNSLVFVESKNIISQETVPEGKTWKIEAVLLDSTTTNLSSNSQENLNQPTININLNDNLFIQVSENSAYSMTYVEAIRYCANLTESGYDDWILGTYEQWESYIANTDSFPENGINSWVRTFPITASIYGGGSYSLGLKIILDSTGFGQFLPSTTTAYYPNSNAPISQSSCRCLR